MQSTMWILKLSSRERFIEIIVFCLASTDLVSTFGKSGSDDVDSDVQVNDDGRVLQLSRRDTSHFRFDPDDEAKDEADDIKTRNDSDYSQLLRRLKRDMDTGTENKGKKVTCMQNLRKFRLLAKNRPLQFVVIVEQGRDARLTCHFCEDTDRITENAEWDEKEASEGKPLWRDMEKIRSPIVWYRVSHMGEQAHGFRMTEVSVNLHDDETENRIYVTSGHTLVIKMTEPVDAGTYFCHDTRDLDAPFIQSFVNGVTMKKLGSTGGFRFLIHLDVLRKSTIPVVLRSEGQKSEDDETKIEKANVRVFRNWGEWGDCSVCDQPGEQRMRGECTVKKLQDDRDSQPWYVNAVLTAQANGVPCRSSLFHTEYSTMKEHPWYSKPDVIAQRPCKVSCLRKEKKIPKTIKIMEGETIQLKCPGVDEVVVWVNNSIYMPAISLHNATNGRASMDLNGTLHISPVRPWDRGLYLCAVGGKEMGHIMLNVTAVVVDELTKYGLWVVYSLPANFLLFLALMVVKHQHRKRILLSSQDSAGDNGSDSNDDNEDDYKSNANVNASASSTTHTECICSSSGEDEIRSESSGDCRCASSMISSEHSRTSTERSRISNGHSRISSERNKISNGHSRISSERSKINNGLSRISSERSRITSDYSRTSSDRSLGSRSYSFPSQTSI